MRSYIKAFKNYANFSGRTSRKDFWMFIIIDFILFMIFVSIETVLGWHTVYSYSPYKGIGYISTVYTVISFLPHLSVQVRRLHDIGKDGTWLLLSLVPGGGLIVLYWCAKASMQEENKYGIPYRKESTKKDSYTEGAEALKASKHVEHENQDDMKLLKQFLLQGMLRNASPERRNAIHNGQRPMDEDYGYDAQNPVCTASIDDSEEYLSKLKTPEGESLIWRREGSVTLKHLHGVDDVSVDIYALMLNDVLYKKICICPYGKEAAGVPKGLSVVEKNASDFILEDFTGKEELSVASKATADYISRMKTVKPESLIDKGSKELDVKGGLKKSGRMTLIICAIFLFCSLAGNVYLYSQNMKIAHEAEVWSDMLDEAQDDRRELLDWKYKVQDEYDYFHKHAVFCSDWNNYYHSYECSDWDTSGFYIFNTENAKYQGYRACPRCQ